MSKQAEAKCPRLFQHDGNKLVTGDRQTRTNDYSSLPAATRRAVDIVRAYDEEVSELAIAVLQELDDDALTTRQAVRMIMRMNNK